MEIVILVGSATPPGRTQAMAETLAHAIRMQLGEPRANIIDLANVAFEPADGRPIEQYDRTIVDAVSKIAAAHAVVIASPVYRATYAGVLKNFLDIVPFQALRDKPVGLAVLAASPHHYLGVDAGVRSILSWYGAVAAPTSVYLTSKDFGENKQPTPVAQAELSGLAQTMVALTAAISTLSFGPTPIAAPRT